MVLVVMLCKGVEGKVGCKEVGSWNARPAWKQEHGNFLDVQCRLSVEDEAARLAMEV